MLLGLLEQFLGNLSLGNVQDCGLLLEFLGGLCLLEHLQLLAALLVGRSADGNRRLLVATSRVGSASGALLISNQWGFVLGCCCLGRKVGKDKAWLASWFC